jgi:hypothetical protein
MLDHVDRNSWNRGRSVYVTCISDAVSKSRPRRTCRGYESRGAQRPITRQCGSLTSMPKWNQTRAAAGNRCTYVGPFFLWGASSSGRGIVNAPFSTPDCTTITRLPSTHPIFTIHCPFLKYRFNIPHLSPCPRPSLKMRLLATRQKTTSGKQEAHQGQWPRSNSSLTGSWLMRTSTT